MRRLPQPFKRFGVGFLAAATIVPLLAGAYGRFIELRWHRLETLDVPVPPTHAGLAGLRLGYLTDLHVGPFISARDVQRAVATLLARKPDLVLLGGDYISESPRFAPEMAAAIAPLAAAPLGAFAVFGNHDLSTDQLCVMESLAANGIRVLVNEAVEVTTERGSLWLVGLDDTVLGAPEPDAAFTAVPANAASIALWHEPDDAAIAAEHGAFLQLSGHTHGGQVRLPGIGPLVLPPGGRRYPAGRFLVDGMVLYVARGTGAYRPPLRFNCRPEITLVQLTGPASARGAGDGDSPLRAAVE